MYDLSVETDMGANFVGLNYSFDVVEDFRLWFAGVVPVGLEVSRKAVIVDGDIGKAALRFHVYIWVYNIRRELLTG